MRVSAALGWLLLAAVPAQQPAPSPFQPFDRTAFAAAMQQAGASDEHLARFTKACAEASEAAAAEALLRTLFADYGAAMQQMEASDPRAVTTLAEVLSKASQPHLVGHARYWLGRMFLEVDDPEGAVDFFADFLKQSRNQTTLDPDVVFFYGTALARIPERDAALRVLQEFLQLFPNAPERYRASAEQLVAELSGKINPLHEIADNMGGVERRIRKTDTGDETQQRQEDVIARLQKIIEEVEEIEKQSSGGGGGSATSPRKESNLTPGATQVGNLGKAGSVTDRWGTLKDRERKAIEGEAEAKLSGRYKKLVQDYYRKLAQNGGK